MCSVLGSLDRGYTYAFVNMKCIILLKAKNILFIVKQDFTCVAHFNVSIYPHCILA